MVAEDFRERVRPAYRINHAAGCIEDASGQQEQQRRQRQPVRQRHRGYDPEPAGRGVNKNAQPTGRARPGELEDHARQRDGPDHAQQAQPPGLVQGQQAERRVAAGDKDKDHRVVQPLEQRAHPPAPRDRVVDRAGAVEHDQADGEDGAARNSPWRLSKKHQEHQAGHRQAGRGQVEVTSQQRPPLLCPHTAVFSTRPRNSRTVARYASGSSACAECELFSKIRSSEFGMPLRSVSWHDAPISS